MTIGDTLTDPGRPAAAAAPRRRRADAADDVRRQHLAARAAATASTSPSRQIKARLDREVLGNVSIEVQPTESRRHVRGPRPRRAPAGGPHRADAPRGLRAARSAARRCILREVDGEIQEPYERITIDIPPDYIGEVQQALAGRKGRLEQMTTDADGRVRMEFVLPVRGLIGYRGQLLTDTRGTALLHQIGEGYGPWAGEVTHRTNGVLVSDRTGTSNAYGLFNLQERAELFIGSGVEVYEGMIVGENARSGDMDVNPTKEKKLTNIRTHAHDEALRLTPPRPLTLESAIEFIAADELVEVTPDGDPAPQAPPRQARARARARPRLRPRAGRRPGLVAQRRHTASAGRVGARHRSWAASTTSARRRPRGRRTASGRAVRHIPLRATRSCRLWAPSRPRGRPPTHVGERGAPSVDSPSPVHRRGLRCSCHIASRQPLPGAARATPGFGAIVSSGVRRSSGRRRLCCRCGGGRGSWLSVECCSAGRNARRQPVYALRFLWSDSRRAAR